MRKVLAALLLLTLAAQAQAQVPVMSGGGNDIVVDDLSAGGSEKTGGGMVLADDTGQESGVETMAGGGMILSSGFIPVALSTAGAAATSQATLPPGGGQTITFSPPPGAVTVAIPAGSFGEAVTVTLQTPASYESPVSPTVVLQGTAVGVEILLDKSLQPSREVTISITYRDADVAGLDESRLIIARFDTVRAVWVPLVSSVDVGNNVVTAGTDHFSKFQVMQAASGNLGEVRVFPNPLRPVQGHTKMTFANLPAGARIRIYTVLGELVRDLTANSSGMVDWDGRNQAGNKAASGVYFALLQEGDVNRTIKVAVQR